MKLLVLRIDGYRYGFPVGVVQELVRAVSITPLADAPPVVEGIISLRGLAAPVFGLRRRFGLPARPLHPDDLFLIVRARRGLTALRSDGEAEVVEVDDARIDDATAIGPGTGAVAGVAALDDGLVVIHDVDRFLSQTEGERLDRALHAFDGR